ncbi:S8 family peptidase [Echinicola marina]|uniref:S8 family peptidase n=1 Tax=Echinicola marina TaxID=2859768 RepID=UPI001CF64440|nr:S8 family peptidase [Echinicola marina]UCS92635.1 S8 family peptidase [Echinicola marina]
MVNIKRRVLVLACILLSASLAFGQDRYVVKYKYKPQSVYSLEKPEEFLTQKALDRRSREGILADSTDLPVAKKYVDKIEEIVEDVIYNSKWFNASVVIATEDQVADLKALDFVVADGVELIAKDFYSTNSNGRSNILNLPVNIKVRTKGSSEDDYAFQNGILGVPDMHAEGLTGEGITIAVFDGGFLNTPDIDGMRHLFDDDKIVATKDFVIPHSGDVFRSETHGTSALSLIAANDVNTLVAGAYDANYILCITEDVASEYRIEEYNWARAAEYADSLGTDIISSSLGYNYFNDPEMNYSKLDLDGETAVITQAANIASKKGILVVTSAGNEGGGSETTITAPADSKGVLAIGSVSQDLSRSSFSSIGPTADGRIKPDLMALGSGVRLWKGSNGTSTSSGTSFSAPQISALAAGIWQGRPEWTKDELVYYLLMSGSNSNDPNSEVGYGVPNFELAYYGEILEVELSPEIYETKIYPNPLEGKDLFIKFGHEDQCTYTLINGSGQVISKDMLSRTSNKDPYELKINSLNKGLYIIELIEGISSERHPILIR